MVSHCSSLRDLVTFQWGDVYNCLAVYTWLAVALLRIKVPRPEGSLVSQQCCDSTLTGCWLRTCSVANTDMPTEDTGKWSWRHLHGIQILWGVKWQERYWLHFRVKHWMELELPSLHTAPVRSWVSTVGNLLAILYPGITVFGFPMDYGKVPYLTPAVSPLASFLPNFYSSQSCSEELLIDVNGEHLTSAAPVFPAPGLGRWLQEPSRRSGINLSVRQLTSHGATRQVGN